MEPAINNRRRVHIPARFPGRFFLALQNRGFRWLWTNGVFAAMAWTVDSMAQGWLVLELTDSPFWVGLAAGISGATTICLSPIAGVIADRVNRVRLIMLMQGIMALVAFLTAYLLITGQIQLWHILVFSFLKGVVTSLNMPARWTLTMDLVGKKALLNATATNFMAFSVMQIISPTIGGILISKLGMGGVYLFIGAGFMAAVAALSRVGYVPRGERLPASPWQNLKEGASYVATSPKIRPLLIMSVVVETFGFSYQQILPVIARDHLGVSATGLGLLTSAGGIGSLIATIVVASLGDFKGKVWILIGGSAGFGIFLILFAASPWFALSLVLLAVAKASAITYDSMMSTLVQTNAPDSMRGRVMSFYALTFGMNPVGGTQAGAVAGFLGAPLAIGVGGAIVTLNALRMITLVPRLQREEKETVAGHKSSEERSII